MHHNPIQPPQPGRQPSHDGRVAQPVQRSHKRLRAHHCITYVTSFTGKGSCRPANKLSTNVSCARVDTAGPDHTPGVQQYVCCRLRQLRMRITLKQPAGTHTSCCRRGFASSASAALSHRGQGQGSLWKQHQQAAASRSSKRQVPE